MKTTRADAAELADFFRQCVKRGRELDKDRRSSDDPITRALMGIVGAAKAGYWDVTGKWLDSDEPVTPEA